MVLALLAVLSKSACAESPVRTAVRDYIETNMPWTPETVRVDFLSRDAKSIPDQGDVVLRIEPAGNQDFIGNEVFLAKFFRNGNLIRTQSVRVRIEVLRDVIIAARPLPSGTTLTENDIGTVRRWVRRIHPQTLPSMEAAKGKRLSTQLSTGAEILSTMLKEIPLVRKGKVVKIVFDNGLMQIITVGLSEEDGFAGNIIRVRNIKSNKIVYARVIDDSLVGIEL